MKASRIDVGSGGRTSGESGFALAIVLLALIGLTALATAGYLHSNTDYRINENHRASMKAFYVADAARADYLAAGKLDYYDTATYAYADGSARAWVDSVAMVDDSSTLFLLTAEGSHTAPDGQTARRRVRSVLIHKVASLAANGAFTAAPGLIKNGSSGTVDGNDASPAGSCTVAQQSNKAGLIVPPGGYTDNGNSKKQQIYGNPPIDDTQSSSTIVNNTGVPWQSMLNGNFAQFDYVVSQDGWPDFSTLPADEWPYILLDSNPAYLQDWMSGRGTIVIPDQAIASGDFNWDGLILVGDDYVSNGIQNVNGSVITGLNMLTGGNPPPSDLGNGTWQYRYHACNVLNALKGIGWPVEEPGSWHEVF